MKDRRTLSRVLALVAVFAVALLLLVGTYGVIANQVSSVRPNTDSPGGPSSTAAWSSGWVPIDQDECLAFEHNLGRDPDDYAVDLWFLDTPGRHGINRRSYGGLEVNNSWSGGYWQNLTANTIEVCRNADDYVADQVRIQVWEPLADSDYASPWTSINPGQTITFEHNVNITATDLVVGLWFSSTTRGIHHFGYGGLGIDGPGLKLGAHWHDLTDNTIQVTRHPHDTDIQQVRVIVVHGDPPDYDSLVDLGDRQSIDRGDTFTFTHGLSWDPNLLLVRAECYTSTAGINQWLAGGNHDIDHGFQGTSLQNLDTDTVVAARWVDDDVCPEVRVRAWRRGPRLYLPIVLSNYEP
jgi:hypothetical protein